MKINNTTGYQPSFKQVNLIQISKKAFPNPDDTIECASKIFEKIEPYTKNPSEKLGKLIIALDLQKYFYKFNVLLESPSYLLSKALTKAHGYSLNWFEQNTKVNFKKPLCEDKHSFFIFTKEDHARTADIASKRNMRRLQTEAMQEFYARQEAGENPSGFLPHALQEKLLDNQFDSVMQDAQIHKFEIENLDDIKNIIGHLDI